MRGKIGFKYFAVVSFSSLVVAGSEVYVGEIAVKVCFCQFVIGQFESPFNGFQSLFVFTLKGE